MYGPSLYGLSLTRLSVRLSRLSVRLSVRLSGLPRSLTSLWFGARVSGRSPDAQFLKRHPFRLSAEPTIEPIDASGHRERWCVARETAHGAWSWEPTDQHWDQPQCGIVLFGAIERLVGRYNVSHRDLDAAAADRHHALGELPFTVPCIRDHVALSIVFLVAVLVIERHRDNAPWGSGAVVGSPTARTDADEADQAHADETGIPTSDIPSDREVQVGGLGAEIPRAACRGMNAGCFQILEVAYATGAAGPHETIVTAPRGDDSTDVFEMSAGDCVRDRPIAAGHAWIVVPEGVVAVREVSPWLARAANLFTGVHALGGLVQHCPLLQLDGFREVVHERVGFL